MNKKMNENLIRVTDDQGRAVLEGDDATEPEPGSVVLTDGEFGSAWQLSFADGKWYCTQRNGGGKTWAWLLTKRNVVLAYDAHPRPEVL